MIRLTIPSIEEDDLQAVREAVASGMLVQGARVAAFEKVVVNYVGSKHAIAVTNCTAALQLSLLALGVSAGDIVVVTAYSWPATANVIELCGAQPVFVDIQPDTFNMNPDALDATLRKLMGNAETARRVKAILPVHTFGQMADMKKILQLAGKHNLPVIEDAACALGSTLDGRQAGAWGVMGCFSFHPRKAITTGEGGMIVTNDNALARAARILRNHGLDPDAPAPDFVAPGFNVRLTEFQAAFGSSQMKKVDRIIAARRSAAERYNKLLDGPGITAPAVTKGAQHVYQSYVTLLPREVAPRRTELIAALKAKGVETTIGTYHMPLTTYYRKRYGFRVGDFPATDDVAARSLSLPLFETLTAAQQEQVTQALAAIIKTGQRAAA